MTSSPRIPSATSTITNFPPYSTGEAYPLRGPRRREVVMGPGRAKRCCP